MPISARSARSPCISSDADGREQLQGRDPLRHRPDRAVVEHVLGVSQSGPGMERSKRMMDINMMASCQGGAKERTVREYEALFAAAGISAPARLVPMRDILSLVEVVL